MGDISFAFTLSPCGGYPKAVKMFNATDSSFALMKLNTTRESVG
jgi:hypothetical protein